MLLAAGPDANAPLKASGETWLLVEAGSDLTLADAESSTALSLVHSYGHLDVAALLEEAGAV